MTIRKLAVSLLASGLAVASGACGSSKGPGPGTDSSSSGGTATSSGGSGSVSVGGSSVAAGGLVGVDDDSLETTGGGTGEVVKNGGHKPLTAEEVAALTSEECSQFDAPIEPQAPVLEFLVDVSGSMGVDVYGCEPRLQNCDAAGGTGGSMGGPGGGQCCERPVPNPMVSKWDLFLPAILDALDGISDNTAVGMQLFPTSAQNNCVSASGRVPIALMGAPGSAQRTALSSGLTGANLVNGTPTHDALDAGSQELDAYTGPGKKFMVLITDGEPTRKLGCEGNGSPPPTPADIPPFTDPIVAAVTAWKAEGIGTFVVGSPGSEVSLSNPPQDMRPFLSKVAFEGGTGADGCMIETAPYCHFDTTASPDFAAALSEGLAKITEVANDPCTLEVPTPPNGENLDKAKTAVILSSSTGPILILGDDTPADCTEGWTWSGDRTITLCPASCAMVKADVGAEVNASFGCETIFN